jgi:hypothetical protein
MTQARKLAWILFACSAFSSGTALAHDVDPDSDADNYAKFWLTLDADRVGGQAMAGTTFTLGDLDLAANVVLTQAYSGVVDPLQNADFHAQVGDDYRAPTARLELGPALSAGGFFFLPKLGIGFDFEREQVAPLVPQLVTIIQGGPVYVESWLQVYLYDLFDDGSQDSFYTRDAILVGLSNHWAVGPQVELTVALQNASGQAVRSLPLGARINFSPAEPITFGLFAAYEFEQVARNSENDFLSGRITATLLW